MNASLRKAAAALYGLSKSDRAWMLKRLPETARQELEVLMTELNVLGFDSEAWASFDLPAEPDIEKAQPSAPAMQMRDEPMDSAVKKIEECPLPILLDWINEEAEWLVAQVLAQRQWSWKESCLAKIGTDKRDRLLRMPRDLQTLPSLLSERLLVRLAEYLENRAGRIGNIAIGRTERKQYERQSGWVKTWLRSFVQHA